MPLLSLIALLAASCGQPGPLYLPAEESPKNAPAQNTQAPPGETETKADQIPEAPPTLYENLPESGMYETQ